MELEIRGLSKSYGKVKALSEASFTLEEGVYGILGPNGAGKSTLINLMTDNVRRESGEILLDGVDISTMKSDYLNYIGYMPQEQGYYADFTVKAFLMYIARLKGLKGKRIKEKTRELIEEFHLGTFCHKKVGSLSGGMRQRVLLAQALLNEPKILILDEPTAGVDPQERINIRNNISRLAEDRIIIIATHIVSDIEAIAKEIVLIKGGRVLKKDTPIHLIQDIEEKTLELEVSAEELEEIQEKYTISNIQHRNDGFSIKIVCDDYKDVFKSRPARANLEDVYLYYFS